MTDITTALETVREALSAYREAFAFGPMWAVPSADVLDAPYAALSTIEAELTRLRAERDSLDAQVRAALRYAEACRLSRDSP